MSASREKKKRQELLADGTVDPRAAREAEKKAAERKSDRLYASVAIVIVVVAVALVVYNSGIFQRNKTAVTIDGTNYNVAETAYYYQLICNNYAGIFGQEYLQSMKNDSYNDDMTWDEYFKNQAVDNLKFVHAAATAAKAGGMALDDSDRDAVQVNIDAAKEAAKNYGYSYGSYLKAMYGPYMTSSIFKSCLEDQLLASKYTSSYGEENFTYTDEELQDYYEENRNAYDLVDGGYLTVSGTPEAKTDDAGNTVDPTDEEKQAALEDAKKLADSLLEEVRNGRDMESIADRYDNVSYTGGEEMTSASLMPNEWLFDEGRSAGDAELLADEENSRYFVARFNSRRRDETPSYNVRHILVTGVTMGLGEGETATEEQLTAKAQELLGMWDGTEEGFAKLAEEYSQDPGSASNGGLYEDVAKNYMVAAFQDWCYEDGRQPGDTGVIYNAGTGAHVMYFVGYGDTQYWQYACENAMRSRDQSAWESSLVESVTAEVNEGGMKYVG